MFGPQLSGIWDNILPDSILHPHNSCWKKHLPGKQNSHQTADWDFCAWFSTASSASHRVAGRFSRRGCSRSQREAEAFGLWLRRQGAFLSPARSPPRTKAGQCCLLGSLSHSCLQETCRVQGWWCLQGKPQLRSRAEVAKKSIKSYKTYVTFYLQQHYWAIRAYSTYVPASSSALHVWMRSRMAELGYHRKTQYLSMASSLSGTSLSVG